MRIVAKALLVANGRAYQIQLSDNNSTWRTVYSTTTSDGGADESEVNATARYVRVHGTQRATQWGYSLWEFAVLGS
ncbi:discoidin domain-containing protein [Actinophytocola glycyrrhizae]|uniref:Discoidin domain-containing protein n=1 Tax=Actinophytocola glycyrrhizae TaxID=2044873 RepID=A0ABV9S336_9PSEU